MAQRWHDLLFAHWPVPEAELRRLVPASLPIDTFEGQAWVGVVPFRMTGVRAHWTPAVPGLSAFPEINVRTYVILDGKPGVYFFSLDAARWLAVMAARLSYYLPYFHARMRCSPAGHTIDYETHRLGPLATSAEFVGRYWPTGDVFRAERGSLANWLTERYCLYTVDGKGRPIRGDILHAPWPLQPAEAEIERNTMAGPSGIILPNVPPLLHFARRLDVVIWRPRSA